MKAQAPPARGAAPRRQVRQALMLGDPAGMAHRQGRRLHQGGTRTGAIALAEIRTQGPEGRGNELYKAGGAHQAGKLRPPGPKDVGRGAGFEGAVVRMVKDDQDRHHLTHTQAAGALALETTARYEMLAPDRLKLLTEIIDSTEHFQ